MGVSSSRPFSRERWLVLALLLGFSAAAWVALIWQSRRLDSDMAMAMGPSLTAGMSAFIFLGMWVLMMVAMMFPTAAPMVLAFNAIGISRQQANAAFVPTWVFVGAYLAVWTAFGVVAYLAAVGADLAGSEVRLVHDNAGRFGGSVLVLAGAYQLSPLKDTCLTRCRTPLQFLMTSWKEGYAGAIRMGVSHGMYCLGCCWLLFVLLFPLGIMNVAIMGVVTLLIFAEKSLAQGVWVGRLVGVGLLAIGLAVIIRPGLLTTNV